MRMRMLPALLGFALALIAGSASAQGWHGYINREVGFSFSAPGEMKTEKVTFKGVDAADRPATQYQSTDDNIVYRVTVIDVGGMAEKDAIAKATTSFHGANKVLSDVEARVEQNYGHKTTVDLPNDGGRSMAGLYFKNGHLIQLDATVLPANGDYGTPDISRFVDSIAFGVGREEPDATEVKLIK